MQGIDQPPSPSPDPTEPDVTKSAGPSSAPGLTIGEYRILRRIGEGGMGVVYEAEQQHPKRLVALKVIRGGRFVLNEHVKLFQREAQALARLRHPGIAAIYETGRTDDGQHFFAMELVRGIPVSDYLQRHKTKTSTPGDRKDRLHLFLSICDAINYAHQRGVIHRDLKPSNIIVSDEGGGNRSGSSSAVAGIKILDFGLARITDADVTATTVLTEAGTVQGTWAYMSPEQARGNPEEIDLRSDVYSLGVILYELTTGVLPYDVNQALPYEKTRVICETPPAPMRRSRVEWRKIGDGQTARIDSDLETITFKALEKEPRRRYQSALALAEDIERYLNDQPILARPPSTVYQVRKLVSRHKAACAFLATVFILLAGFGFVMALQSARIARERDRALVAEQRSSQEAELAHQVSAFLLDLFKVSDPGEARGNRITAREILDRGSDRIARDLKGQPAVQARLMDTMGQVYQRLGLYSRAGPLLEDALAIRRRTLGDAHAEVGETMHNLGELMFSKGDLAEAERFLREALAVRRQALGDEHLAVAATENSLAITLRRRETPETNAEAERLYRTALATRRKLLGKEHTDIASNLVNLALFLYANKGEAVEAERLFREALDMNRRLLGPEHLEVGITLNNFALLLRGQGRYAEAEPLFREALAIDRKMLGEDHPDVAIVINNLAALLQRKGDYAGAEASYREAIDQYRKTFSDDHWQVATVKSLLGGCLLTAGRYREAEPLLLESHTVIRGAFGESHNRTRVALTRIVDLYTAWGKPDTAAKYRVMLQRTGTAP